MIVPDVGRSTVHYGCPRCKLRLYASCRVWLLVFFFLAWMVCVRQTMETKFPPVKLYHCEARHTIRTSARYLDQHTRSRSPSLPSASRASVINRIITSILRLVYAHCEEELSASCGKAPRPFRQVQNNTDEPKFRHQPNHQQVTGVIRSSWVCLVTFGGRSTSIDIV